MSYKAQPLINRQAQKVLESKKQTWLKYINQIVQKGLNQRPGKTFFHGEDFWFLQFSVDLHQTMVLDRQGNYTCPVVGLVHCMCQDERGQNGRSSPIKWQICILQNGRRMSMADLQSRQPRYFHYGRMIWHDGLYPPDDLWSPSQLQEKWLTLRESQKYHNTADELFVETVAEERTPDLHQNDLLSRGNQGASRQEAKRNWCVWLVLWGSKSGYLFPGFCDGFFNFLVDWSKFLFPMFLCFFVYF